MQKLLSKVTHSKSLAFTLIQVNVSQSEVLHLLEQKANYTSYKEEKIWELFPNSRLQSTMCFMAKHLLRFILNSKFTSSAVQSEASLSARVKVFSFCLLCLSTRALLRSQSSCLRICITVHICQGLLEKGMSPKQINNMTLASRSLDSSKNGNKRNRPQRVFSKWIVLSPNSLKRFPFIVKDFSIGDSLNTSYDLFVKYRTNM